MDANSAQVPQHVKHPGFLAGLFWASIMATALLCRAIVGQQANDAPFPDASKLAKTIGEADRVEVYDGNEFAGERRIYSSSNLRDLTALKASIRLEEPVQWGQSACDPSTILRFFQGKKVIGELGLICGDIARFSQWSSDAQINNPEPLFEWLDSRGITTPRKEFERERTLEEKSRADEERWRKAMPSSILQLWPSVHPDVFYKYDTRPLEEALSKEFPDGRARILRLMAWYGSGAGPWSGFPGYEDIPEQMLLQYPTPELVDAVTGSTLNEQELEGAARLFGGWDFNHTRPKDNALLPADLKRILLEHSLKSTDKDKLERARRAFAISDSKVNP
ncbi:MAG: hypothetical protein ACLP7O_13330 [Terracidiphilus sp.]